MPKVAVALALGGLLWCAQLDGKARRPVRGAMRMEATAFARAGRPTAAGTEPHEGTVAADPRVLPLGTRIRIAGSQGFDGNYLVTDTGADVKGRHIDLYLPSIAEARRFGKKTVRVYIRRMGTGKADAQRKDTGHAPAPRD